MKSTLLFKLRVPGDLLEAANPGCPEQLPAGETVSLGMCRSFSPRRLLVPTTSVHMPADPCLDKQLVM